jgi:hypothetical protein
VLADASVSLLRATLRYDAIGAACACCSLVPIISLALRFERGVSANATRILLIAQSLNQIESAYVPNNAILDNCHVRVSFVANDEWTVKRVSDALGTATEIPARSCSSCPPTSSCSRRRK